MFEVKISKLNLRPSFDLNNLGKHKFVYPIDAKNYFGFLFCLGLARSSSKKCIVM